MNWIIAYDIADRHRLQRAHRYLTQIAIPLQNSVFLFTGSLHAFEQHFATLTQKLNAQEDDVRVYPLRGKLYNLGTPCLPSGIFLTNLPEVSLQLLDDNRENV